MTPEDVEKEKKRDKKIIKTLRRAAISVGAGLGLMGLTLLLPEISDKEKMNAMKGLLSITGEYVIAYGIAMTLAVFFLRSRVLLIDALMNWLVVPGVALWLVTQAYGILAQSG